MICETWFTNKIDSSNITLDGYNLFRNDRHKRKGGGVCIYVRSEITSEVIWPAIHSNPSVEIVVLKCKYYQRSYFIACCYYPPKPLYSPDQFNDVITCVFEIISSYDEDDAIIVLAGDLNQLDSDFLCNKYGLVQLVDTPTHDGNILDKFFTNRPDIYNNWFPMKSTVKTKHLAVLVYNGVDQVHRNANRRKSLFYDTRSHNIDKLRRAIALFDWSILLECFNIQILYTRFLAVCKYLISASIPVKTITMWTRDPEYITPLVKGLLRKRYKLRRRGRVAEADVLAQKINQLIANVRSKRLSQLNNVSTKVLWKNVNAHYRDAAVGNLRSLLFDVNNACEYFANVSFDPTYDQANVAKFCKLPDCVYAGPYVSAADITPLCVERLLRSVKSTSPGTDDLPCWFFQTCSVELAEIVCHIFNCSITSGIVPAQWSTAIVTPIPKIPHPQSLGDLRPISVTPILSRLAEKLIVNLWLRPSIPAHSVADQFAFRPTGSTTSALVYLMHHVTSLLESNNYVRCLLIDFSKAFDIVDHAIIVEKLTKLPLPWNVINWFISFLTARKIVLKFDSVLSKPKIINRSIVQGSGVGPTMYILHESDLRLISRVNILLKYADDTNVLTPEITDVSLSDEFENIKKWASVNKMVINLSKTKEIVFHRPNPRHSLDPYPLAFIEQVRETKLLGLVLNHRMSFNAHVQYIMRQCSQRLYLMKLLRKQGLPNKQLNIVFQAIIVSRVQYAVSAWGGFLTADLIQQIDAFFSRAHRIGLCDDISFASLLFAADQTLFSSMTKPEHCLHSLLPPVKSNQYNLRERGHEHLLPEFRTCLYKQSFLLRYLYQTI